jgi:hypothetical protein
VIGECGWESEDLLVERTTGGSLPLNPLASFNLFGNEIGARSYHFDVCRTTCERIGAVRADKCSEKCFPIRSDLRF